MTSRITAVLAAVLIAANAHAGLPNPPPTTVSEPATLWLMLVGASAIALAVRLRNRK